jgi:RHS repeat-associated protein
LVAPATLILVACQSAGDGSIQPAIQVSLPPPTQLLAPDSSILNVLQTADSGKVILQFHSGTSAATASAAGRRYGLDMIGGPLISGPLPSGRFIFEIPQIDIQASTPTTGRVYFPTFIKPSDRSTYLVQHHLRLIRWVRGMDDVIVAEVRLPAAPLNPTLLDPIAGLFQVALPVGLDLGSVIDWAKTLAMRVVSYDPLSGSTVVHPNSWHPVVPRPISYYPSPTTQYTPPPPAPAGTLYVQFATGISSDTIGTLATKLGLGVASIGPTNLAILSGDRVTTSAAIQLFSDNPNVQCIGLSANPCVGATAPVANATVASQAPSYGQPASVSVSLVDGMLEASWQAATGASAYAIFSSSSPGGAYRLVAIVAGQTSYAAFDQTAPGSSVYYQVVAVHPCTQSSDSGPCDVAVVPFGGQGTPAASWTNPVTLPAPVTQQPAPSPVPSPVATTQPDVAPSPSPLASDPSTPTPSPATSAVAATPPPTAPAPPAPSAPPVVAQAPQQTQLGPAPLAAPVGVEAAPADGHVTLSWQPVSGASAYRVYRSTGGGAAGYVATTSEVTFTDTGGAAGTSYSYQVSGVAGSGLVGTLSDVVSTSWQADTAAPVVLRSLPAEVGALSGTVRLQVDARSGDGRGQVQWTLSGAAGHLTIGTAIGQPSATAPLSWSSTLAWDSNSVPDGSYTISAIVFGTSGQQTTLTSTYRIQNAAPIAPINLSAVAQGGGVAVTWEQAASATGSSYRLYRDQPISGNPLIQLSADSRSYVDVGAQPGQHQYQLVLADAQGRTSQTATAQVTVAPREAMQPQPQAAPDLQVLLPTGEALAAGGRATDRVLLVAPAMNDLSFQISSDGRSWSGLQQPSTCSAGACTLDLSLDSLAPGPYGVRALAAAQPSPAHTFVRADATRYSAPTGLTAQLTGLGVQLSWAPPAAALPASYQVSRRMQGGDWKLLDQVASTSFIDATPPVGAASDYRVSAVDTEGSVGSPSSPVTVSVPLTELAELQGHGPPAAPANVQATAAHGRATLRWDSVAGNDGYLVQRQLEPDGLFATAGTTSTTSFVDTPSTAAREIAYRVETLNGVVAGDPSANATTLVIPASPPLSLTQSAPNADRPVAPIGITTSVQAGSVQISWSPGTVAPGTSTAPASSFNVYRLDPATGRYGLAASGLEASSFNDVALPSPARFGYVITASSVSGVESAFSDPVWVTVAPASSAPSIQFMAPTPTEASLLDADSLRALASITAAAGLDQVSFAIAPAGGLWNQLSAVPVDPRAPLPGPLTGAAPAALWGTTLNTTSMAPGSYKLRVQVRDRAGMTQEQVQDLFIARSAARGPPAFALNATPIPGGVHLQWTAPTSGSFLVQRSIFGSNGPFETVASVQTEQYDDHLTIGGHSYAYQVVELGSSNASSTVVTASALVGLSSTADGGPSLSLGPVSQSELSTAIASTTSAHPLTSGLQRLGTSYDINTTSLATNQPVHHLGEQAQITFILPPGLSSEAAASSAIYHWDDSSGTWVQETSMVDATLNTVTATINHLSQFVVGSSSPAAGGGSIAQPPAPPTDFRGAPQQAPSSNLTATEPAQDLGPLGPEVVSARTANSSVYQNPDGSLRQVISAGLVNYQDANGVWQKIDTTLVPVGMSTNYVRNSAGPVQVQLPGDLSASPVQISMPGGTLAFSLEGAQSSSRAVSGSTANYAAVETGIDLNYTTIPEGLKEALVIRTKPAQTPVFTFDLTAGSLTLRQLPSRAVEAVDGAGQVVFTIQSPFMHDAPTAQSELGSVSDAVVVTLSGGSGSYRLTYAPDSNWLNDPSRLYPVTLDPTVTYNATSGGEPDAQINDCWPTSNYYSYTYLPIGYTPFTSPSACNGRSRAMISFTIPTGGTVATSAQMKLWQYTNYRGGGKVTTATPMAGSWSASSVTWNTAAAAGLTCAIGCPATTTLNGTGWDLWDMSGPVQAWQQQGYANYGFEVSGDESACCTQEFFYSGSYSDQSVRPQLILTYADESASIAWQGPPQIVNAVAGSLISIPITVTNTANQIGGSLTWHAYNHADLVRVGTRDYRTTAGAIVGLTNTNFRTYLPADVAPGSSVNLTAVIQAPGDPGDYLLRLDLVHEVTGSAPIWFADQGNRPLEVRARIVAPGDAKTTQVPMAIGDGSSLAVNTSNGFATLSATDITISERGGASLHLERTYNGVNGVLSGSGIGGTGVTSSTYGVGWTYDFQRSIHLGSLATNTYDSSSGILTDGQGRAWTLTWNPGRGLYEDAAGNRTVAPSSAQVVATASTLSVPMRPVDLLNGSGSMVADASAPGGYALRLEATSGPPTALIMPAGAVPAQQTGTIEFWFRPNFDMSVDTGCHVFFADTQLRFGLAWNCSSSSYLWGSPTARAVDFFTYDADSSTYQILSSAAVTWANGTWHHIAVTWAEGGTKQLMTDTITPYSVTTHGQSPITDLIFGYQPALNNGGLNYLNGRITQLRVDGQVVPGTTLNLDAAPGTSLSGDQYTLYLGHYDSASPQSSYGIYLLRNADQSTETYSMYGVLQNEADRIGNQIDYLYDSSGRIQTISDHSISGRTITFSYNSGSFVATDFAGRSITYQLGGSGDLTSVTRSNQVPDPRTGVFTPQNATTSYSYASGHLLQQIADPRGAKTTVNYDPSYRQAVLIDNPTAYWRLGEISGTTVADSANSYTGTIHGGVTLGMGGAVWNDSDYAMKFDGSTGYISASIAAIAAAAPYAVEAWVKQAGSAGSQTIVAFTQGASAGMLWLNAGTPTLRVGTDAGFVDVAAAAAISSCWHHLVGAYDGANARLYVDGQLAGGPTGVASGSGSTSLWIASQNGTSNFFNGTVDEVAIYPAALSAQRVLGHYIAGRLRVGASSNGYAANVVLDNPVGYWRLPETRDQSGAGNNGTISGGVSAVQTGALTTDSDLAASFDGSTGYISTGPIGSLPRWTLEAWINPSGNQTTDAAVISDVYSSLVNYALWFNFSGSTPLGLVTGFYDGAWHTTNPVNVGLGSWTHVASTYDGSTIRLYIDGSLQSSLSYTASPVSNGIGLRIGRIWNGTNDFLGNIDEAAVYPIALPSSRILAHYLAGRAAPLLGSSPYPLAVASDKPNGYWRMGETSGGSAADSSGFGNPGTYGGTLTFGQAGAIPTDPGSGISFNGSTGLVRFSTNPVALQLSNATIEAWINTTTTSQSAIASKTDAWWFGVQPNGKLGFYDPSAHVMRDSGAVVNDGRWHYVAAVFQTGIASGSQMYVDGAPAGSPFQMTVVDQNLEMEIASYYSAGQFFNGLIQEVALYPALLSAVRIRAHYQASRLNPIPATGWSSAGYAGNVSADKPVAYWRLDEASGSAANDRSGLNNTGTYSATGVTRGQPGALATDGDTAVAFDGSSGSLMVPASSSLNIAGPMTIEGWVRKTSQTTGPLMEYNNGASVGVSFWSWPTWDVADANFIDTSGTSHAVISAGGQFVVGQWYYLAATYDGAYGTLYINGSQVARTYLGSFTPQTSYAFYVANRPSSNTYLGGLVDDVAIYPRALTAARILSHYNAAWDLTLDRVATIQDARGTTAASFLYNDETATTQVIDARGLPSYYTFQSYGGRTLSVTDTGNNLTSYQYDGGAPYRLIATVSPTGIRHSQLMNSGAPVGQQSQVLMADDAGQPGATASALMSGGYPDPSIYGSATPGSANESWIWDPTVTVQPGVPSHRSTGYAGMHQHYVNFGIGALVPTDATISQWVYIEPGMQPPSELMVQFYANDSTGWQHRAWWGNYDLIVGTGNACPSNCRQSMLLPAAGRWALLTIPLGPTPGATSVVDVGMAGRTLGGVAFTIFGGTGSVWWGPTIFGVPGASVSDPTRAVSRYAYNTSNDVIAMVDPNGIATVRDVDSTGLTRVASSGVEPAAARNLIQDNVAAYAITNCPYTGTLVSQWTFESCQSGPSAGAGGTPHNGVGSLTQTHTGAGQESDFFHDFYGLTPGTYVQVSVWIMTSIGSQGNGGASLILENALAFPLNLQRRSGSVQTNGNWALLTLPFVIDSSGQLRVRLWQENLQGTTTWADLHVDDLTPAADVTLQHPLAVYSAGFEVQPVTVWNLGTAIVLNDSSQAHSGQYSLKDTLASSSSSNIISNGFSLPVNATYRVSVWARTLASGGVGGTGPEICTQLSVYSCTTFAVTEGQWQQDQVTVSGSGTFTLLLEHQNFQGDVYWDDINVERVADATPASSGVWQGTSWTGSVTTPATATWASSWTGGVGGGPSRQASITSSSTLTDIRDALPTAVLRSGASYVISVWASSSVANTSIDFSLRDASFNALGMDSTTSCVLQTTPTLCQNSITYAGSDRASNYLVIYYGNQGARTVAISHPLVALQATRIDYTSAGRPNHVFDVFGHSTTTTYDSNGLYPTQTLVAATPSPNLTTNLVYNSIGQLILSTKVNGSQSIAEQLWLDSWGRQVGVVQNCVAAVAPPSLCNASANAATNVLTRYSYDLDGNLTDRYDQAQVSGNWVDTRYMYDANANQVGRVQNCITATNPCDGASNPAQNVVTTLAYDALNHIVDAYAPMPGCAPTSTPCVQLPVCVSGAPACALGTAPCPATTCVDNRTVYDTTGRVAQQIANFGGSQDASQANVTTQFAYDGDGRVVDIYTPITSATLQTGQIDEHKIYDVLGRLITDIKANSIPSWMAATTAAQTDYTLDAGGRVISVTGPGTGSTSNANRIVTTTDYDDLGRPLYVTADSGGTGHLHAVSRTVYDPRGGVHNWTPPTQQLSAGLETSTNYDLAGHTTSVVRDDGSGGLHLTTSSSYDGYGRPTDVIDPRGIDTNTAYDGLDRASSVTQNYCPSGNSNSNCTGSGILADQNLTTSYVYDLAGNRIEVINQRSIIEYTASDALRRAILTTANCQTVPTPPATSCGTQSSDQNVSSQQSLDQAGDLLTTTDPLGRLNVFAYDALGRRVSQTLNCVTVTNPCDGGVTSGQNLTTTWQVDAQGDVLKETTPRQCTSTAPCYTGPSGPSITDGANLATGYLYDGLLRLVSVTEDQGSSANGHLNLLTTYSYDPSGNKLSATDGRNYSTPYTVDNLGRVTKVTDATSNAVQTNYSLAGEVTSTIDGRGTTNTYTLDRVGRVTGVSYYKADGTTQLTQSFGYDADGNQTSFSDSDVAQTTVSFDHLNRPSTVTAPSPQLPTVFTYFLDGAINTVADSTGTTTFAEDHLGRIATMVDPLTSATTHYTFDAASRLTGRTEANGIVTSVTYTGMDQLASKTEVAGSTALASWTSLTYDLTQNRTGETLAYYSGNPYPDAQAGSATYKYDSLNQISQSAVPNQTSAGYGFDGAHNLTSNAGTTQTYNNNESLQTVGAATVGSDADGNQQKDVAGNTLSWNSLSQLEKFSTTESYIYDALGRLTKVTNGSNVTQFVYRGLSGEVIEELNGSGTVIRSYSWDTAGRQIYVKSGSNVYYEITNPHGDVAALASATALVGTEHFDAWANPFTPSGTTTPFGFQGSQGSWTDSTTGFVSMGVRWYYPKVGRFLSSDPVAGTADPRTPIAGLRWLYGLNSPLENMDPTGLANWIGPMDSGCVAPCPSQNASSGTAAGAPTVSHQTSVACGRGPCSPAPAANTTCTVGGQDCGTFLSHAGSSFLSDFCGITICPVIRGAQSTYTLATDQSGWWKGQTDQWNASKAYWTDVHNTYEKAATGPVGWIPGAASALFGLKWSGDRISDFEKDPGSGTGHILFFDVTMLAGPKFVGAARGAPTPEALDAGSYADPVAGGRLPAFTGGQTRGILHVPGNDLLGDVPLESGYGGPTAAIPKATYPGFNNLIRSHVEAHAAAIMRMLDMGEGDEAALEINRIPCDGINGCQVNLPRMLPPGSTLHIYGPDGYYEPWVGEPD